MTGLGFATRDHGAKNEEDQGLLEFVTLKNDKFFTFFLKKTNIFPEHMKA